MSWSFVRRYTNDVIYVYRVEKFTFHLTRSLVFLVPKKHIALLDTSTETPGILPVKDSRLYSVIRLP